MCVNIEVNNITIYRGGVVTEFKPGNGNSSGSTLPGVLAIKFDNQY